MLINIVLQNNEFIFLYNFTSGLYVRLVSCNWYAASWWLHFPVQLGRFYFRLVYPIDHITGKVPLWGVNKKREAPSRGITILKFLKAHLYSSTPEAISEIVSLQMGKRRSRIRKVSHPNWYLRTVSIWGAHSPGWKMQWVEKDRAYLRGECKQKRNSKSRKCRVN